MVGHRSRHRVVALCAAAVVFALTSGASARAVDPAGPPVAYRAPVPGPVIDPYRAPVNQYAAGNRGIDYATTPGEPIGAAAGGEVTFAGQVGGSLHVVVLHADGIRTSLSFLASVSVRRGQRVSAGQIVGRAGAGLHLGARRGEEYLDPATLLVPETPAAGGRVRLVPADPARQLGESAEASGLQRLLGGLTRPVVGGAAAGGRWVAAVEQRGGAAAVDAARRAQELGAPAALVLLAEAQRAMAPAGPCTAAGAAPPGRDPGRRRIVLVGGLGSSSTAAAIHNVAVGALGYAPRDVVIFSYRGGDISSTPYGATDTFGGVEAPAGRLRALVAQLTAAEPAIPIDLVGHSMGGLVVRAALVGAGAPSATGAVVTLGTPHTGANLAGGAQRLLNGPTGPVWRGVSELLVRTGVDLDMASLSVRQLAPGSALLETLRAASPPQAAGQILAVGARTDLVVPVQRARWPGQRSVTVDVPGPAPAVHAGLPGSAAATRELALVLAGAPPTCRSSDDRLLDALAGLLVEVVTDATAAGLDINDTVMGGGGFVPAARAR